MQISPQNTLDQGFVLDRNGQLIKDSNYFEHKFSSSIDLVIREILVKAENDTVTSVTSYIVKPRETVTLISEQRVSIAPGYIAYVFLKNRLSQNGILALNTGILDGGFTGPISTIVTNFSSRPVSLASLTPSNRGIDTIHKSFFRVVIHKIELTEEEINKVKKSNYTYEKYRSMKERDLDSLPNFFLDPTKQQHEMKLDFDQKISDIKDVNFSKYLAIAGFIIPILFIFLAPLGKVFSDGLFFSKNQIDSDIIKLEKKINVLEAKLHDLLVYKIGTNSKDNDKSEEFINATFHKIEALNHKLDVLTKDKVQSNNMDVLLSDFIEFKKEAKSYKSTWNQKTSTYLSKQNTVSNDILKKIKDIDTKMALLMNKLNLAIDNLK
jgi:deoxycytidine triphosphate deaminase